MAKDRKRAYTQTSVPIDRSREAIAKILRNWGVSNIAWEDDFDNGVATLRFRWKREDESALVARFRVDLDSEEILQKNAIDGRSGSFSEKKYKRLLADRGKKEHRLLLNLLKNMFEAIEAGIIPAESVLLPWLEDVDGQTVYEKVAPRLDQLASKPLHKALAAGEK